MFSMWGFETGAANEAEMRTLILPMLMAAAERTKEKYIMFSGAEVKAVKHATDYGWNRDPETGNIVFWVKPCTGDDDSCTKEPDGIPDPAKLSF